MTHLSRRNTESSDILPDFQNDNDRVQRPQVFGVLSDNRLRLLAGWKRALTPLILFHVWPNYSEAIWFYF